MNKELEKNYNPSEIEDRLYTFYPTISDIIYPPFLI